MTTIALDAMGADEGVTPLVTGAAQLSLEDLPLEVRLVGDRDAIQKVLDATDHDPKKLSVVHAPTALAMTDKPGDALDQHPDCSILRACDVVKAREADVLVSAGNTGGVILAASRRFERLEGVRRVGLAAVHPTVERHGPKGDPFALMLDVGATLHCEASDLVAFAVMGSAYSRIISDIEAPRVGLLSNGSEPGKGTKAIIEAHQRLANLGRLAFAGNVEGLDIPKGSVDVVVTEGFVGNIVLKMLEGVGEVAKELARAAYGEKLRYKIALGMLAGGIRKVKNLTDWKQYGGAPIVGFDHLVIKAHGRSNARAVRNAIKVAAKTVERKLSEQIREDLASGVLQR
ncbi:MAG: phosphate acyltransferase PlsX [Myxococcales bacterium]|nr:phosphate acyltransferase PlsX [Myxococcales bacterium]